ncbi:MAG: MATE family efflux transporter [Spirochaetales bacterium]|nr:MATE family efflux transporter [Spirochaetales bacterium]
MRSRKTMNMTDGVIWRQLVAFAIPLLLGNFFQQLYNTADSIVVGNFVGPYALGAVTSVAPAINTLIGFFMGLATGAGVVISQNFGASNFDGLTRAIHTAIAMTFLGSFLIAGIGVACAPYMLKWMQTPFEVYPLALDYLRIYFAGILGLMMYNMGAGILRAVGDSTRPLYFLIFSTVLNIGLDILFVAVFDLGVKGVAYATILSQLISDILILNLLFRTKEAYKISLKKMKIDPHMLRRIFDIGIPAALQQAITAFSNMFVQSYVNEFGAAGTAGWGIFTRMDTFVNLPMQSMSLSVTTFVGQNTGAGKVDRIRKGIRTSLVISLLVTLCICILLWLFAPQVIGLFTQDMSVSEYGVLFIRLITPFSLLSVWNSIHAGSLRGMGNSRTPMLIMLGSFVLFRQIYLFVISRISDSVILVALGYPAGWLICSLLMLLYFRHSHWEEKIKSVS